MFEGVHAKIDQVIDAVVGGWNWLTSTWRWTWDRLAEKFEMIKTAVVATLGAIGVFFYDAVISGIETCVDSIESLKESGTQMANGWQASFAPVLEWMQKANAVLPLEEMIAVLVALFVLWQVAILYRAVKSYIPTLS